MFSPGVTGTGPRNNGRDCLGMVSNFKSESGDKYIKSVGIKSRTSCTEMTAQGSLCAKVRGTAMACHRLCLIKLNHLH